MTFCPPLHECGGYPQHHVPLLLGTWLMKLLSTIIDKKLNFKYDHGNGLAFFSKSFAMF